MNRKGIATIGGLILALAACNAIAGLDGDFEAVDAGPSALKPNGGTTSGAATSSGATSGGDGTSSSSGDGTSGTSGDGTSGTSGTSSGADASSSSSGADASSSSSSSSSSSGAPVSFCPIAGSLFCNDFEKDKVTPFGWTTVYKGDTDVGTLSIGTPGAPPGNSTLNSALTGGTKDRSIALVQTLDPSAIATGKGITLDFDFQVISISADYVAIGVILVNGAEYGIALYKQSVTGCDGGLCVDQTEPGDTHKYTGAKGIAVKTWYHGTVTAKRVAGDYSGVVNAAGAQVDSRGTGAFKDTTTTATKLEVSVGTFFGGSGNADVQIDNVKVTAAL